MISGQRSGGSQRAWATRAWRVRGWNYKEKDILWTNSVTEDALCKASYLKKRCQFRLGNILRGCRANEISSIPPFPCCQIKLASYFTSLVNATIRGAKENMSASLVLINPISVSRSEQIRFTSNMSIRSWRRKPLAIRCHCLKKERLGRDKNYYELLGVSIDSTPKQIKDAYRKLQKKHHPDIAGREGHEHTLLLNEAYKVLMRQDLRREYDISIGQKQNASVLGYSSWKGPLRPQALFVDENACIGCRECVHHAGKTFTMDENLGCAQAEVQFGDDDGDIEVAVDSCPVNCIYWVNSEELAVLEYLIRPQQKAGYGIYGQGWVRPANVFAAAKAFAKQPNQQPGSSSRMWYPSTVMDISISYSFI